MRNSDHTVFRVIPCPAWDIEAMENWLSDLAEEGLFLQKSDKMLNLAAFYRGNPKKAVYRLEAERRLCRSQSSWSLPGNSVGSTLPDAADSLSIAAPHQE